MAGTVWDDVLGRIETKVNSHTYHSWFVPIAFARDDGHAIVVRAADAMTIDWLVKHYAAVIDEALKEIGRTGTRVVFESDAPDAPVRPILVHSNPDPPAPGPRSRFRSAGSRR